jgi:hypothetical protein
MSMHRHVLAVLASAAVLPAIASAASASPLSDLPGRWSGSGSILLANGSSERVKCVANYSVQGDKGLRQNLRCASTSYRIDAIANLRIAKTAVAGSWNESNYSASGGVTGRMTGSGFNLRIRGDNFSAGFSLTTTACKQSINITPHGFQIARISIGLGKC